MPEPYYPKRKAYLLSEAKCDGMVVRIRCTYHKRQHWFVIEDLIRLFGDVDVDSIAYRMRCQECRNFVDVKGEVVSAAERQSMRFRRLVEVKHYRRPVWRDE